MGFELHLDLGDYPPAARPAPTRRAIVGIADPASQGTLGSPVRPAGSGFAHELAIDDLVKALFLRDREEIDGGGERDSSGDRHARSIARPVVERIEVHGNGLYARRTDYVLLLRFPLPRRSRLAANEARLPIESGLCRFRFPGAPIRETMAP